MAKNLTVSIPSNNYDNSTTFGGIISLSDFFTNCSTKSNTRSPIAGKIAQDKNFDRMCQRNILNKETYNRRKNNEKKA